MKLAGVISLLFCLGIASSYGAVKYVKYNASGANNGTSWANAYTDLQNAIGNAAAGDQVWVASGTYKPSSWPNGGAGERYKHFSLKPGVAVYGGFSGVESLLTNRDINTNKVICSGDIGVAGDNSDNCYQVFYHPFGTGLDNTAVLDGVTVSGGNANGSSPYNFGGGMYNSGCAPSIVKCTFTSNTTSASGGAMYNYGCAPVVSYCSFIGNSALDGGGIYNTNTSNTNISGSFFSGNTASASGGAIFTTDSNPIVENNTFVSNTAVNGGAMYNYYSFPSINDCTFTGNSASTNGGAIYCAYNSSPSPVFSVKNCIFWNNGGADKEIVKTNITASVSYCVVQGGYTGGTNIITTDPQLYSPCLNGGFSNTCAITSASSAVFIPKTAASNTWNGSSAYDQRACARAPSGSRAAGAYEPSYGYPSIVTTTPSEIAKTSAVSGVSFVDTGNGYTVTQKGVCWSTTSGPTISNSKTTDGSGLTAASSNITGLTQNTNYYVRAYAQLNEGTVLYGQEIQFKSLMVYYVVVGGTGNIDGSSWSNALGDLQVAISMASAGDEVWVAQGTYKPDSWPNGGSTAREKHFSLKRGVQVIGGFLGNENSREQRNYKTNVTTLSGDIGVLGDNTDNCYHVFYHPNGLGLDSSTIIDGLTITSGYANYFGGNADLSKCSGAGMYNDNQSLKIQNCIFSSNSIFENENRNHYERGGAIFNLNSNVEINYSSFSNNTITVTDGSNDTFGKGGAIYSSGGTAIIEHCVFESNSINYLYYSAYGGAICSENTNLTVSFCLFKNNQTNVQNRASEPVEHSFGGAIYCSGLSPVIFNSSFYENDAIGGAPKKGGAVYTNNSSVIINSCTFNNNSSSDVGGAIYLEGGSPTVKNSLLWGNGGTGKELNGTVTGTVSYCVIEGGYAGGTNIVTSDPQLQALSDNGGYTQTIAIPGNSSAVAIPQYAGSNDWNGTPYLDQRGYAKRLTGVRGIGAYDPNSKSSFAVNFASAGNGSLSGTVSQTVAPMGSATAVTANPNTNYTFSGWTGDYVGTENPLTITNVSKDMSVTANFALKSYTVSFAPGTAGGSISGTATQTIQHGGSCTAVTAVANTGYHFVNWTGDYSGTSNPLTISNVTANKTIAANFAITQYTLTYNAGTGGALTGISPQTVNHGSNGTAVTAVANSGYHFTGWSDGVASASRTDTNITANKSVTANFAINSYTVTFDLAGKGTRSGGGFLSQTINHGSGATAPTVTPSAGWSFTGWDKAFSNISGDTTVTAQYSVATYTVTFVQGANGTITGTKVQTVSYGGSSTEVTAVPSTGYHFMNWTGSITSTSNPLTVSNITSAMTITANFAINTYTVTFDLAGKGTRSGGGVISQTINHGSGATAPSVTSNAGWTFTGWDKTFENISGDTAVTAQYSVATYTVTFVQGANGTITGTKVQTVSNRSSSTEVAAVPSTGYHFVNWTGGITSTANPLTVSNVTSAMTITANFAINTYTVTFDLAGKGTRSGGGALSQTINHGSGATAPTVTSNAGWSFTGWDKTFENISGDTAVTAQYSVATYTVTFVQGSNGTITGTKVQTVGHGSSSTEVAGVPSTGYHFVNWTGGITSTANPLTVSNVTSAMTITANFAINTYALAYSPGSNGTLSGTTSQTVNHGANGTAVTAVPNSGYHFTGWSDGLTDNPRTDNAVTAAKSVTANFALNSVAILTDLNSLNVPELGTAIFKVKLSAQPTSSVTVSVNWTSGDADITVSAGSSLTFSTSSWDSYQNVTLAAAKDADASNGTATITCSASGLTDKVITATEIDNDYTLTVSNDGNGRTDPAGATFVQKGSAKSISATPNTGYSFVNWTITSGTGSFGNANSATTTFTASANATIRANFVINTYMLNFNSGSNGKVTGITPQTINHGANGTAATAEPNAGYHFTNWTGDYTGTQNPLTISNVVSNKMVTANFAINSYTVTFDLVGKGARTGEGELIQTVNHGSAAIAPTVVASPGWTFTGWDKVFDNISSELTVNAQYSAATYTVTYDAEGGAVSPPNKIVTYNAAYGTLDIPTRNGYTFAGWWTGDNGTGTQVTQMTTVSNTANHTIYAKWTANTYTVTYDAQGGTVSPANKSVTFGAAYGALASPARNGYAFAGWWTGLNGSGSKLSSATIVSNAANHSIYAKWVVSAVGVALETPIPPEFAGLKVTVKGLPSGLRYDAASGKIIGVPSKPGVYIVEISALGVPTQTITISAGALPLWAQGTFDGTVSLDLIDDTDNWNNYPGTATMTVTSLGKISGKLSAGGKSCTFSATSYSPTDEDGVLGFQAIAKIGTTSVPLSFRVSQPAVVQEVSVTSALLGSKADGTYDGADIKCEIHMYRNVWKDSDMAALLPDYVGYYTAVLPGGAEYGSGYLAMTVDRAGGVKTTGKLADGTALSLSGTLIFRNEPACVFAVIYTSPAAYQGGCLFGLAKFAKPEGADKMLLSILDEESLFRWESCNSQATAVYGDGGFNRELGLVGGWYDKTGNLYAYYQGKDLFASTDTGASAPELIVGLNRYASACWKFSDIALTPVLKSAAMTGLAVVPKAGLPVNLGGNNWNYDAENTAVLTIGLTRATGIFKGSFKAWFDYNTTHASRSISYEGVLTPDWEATNDFVEGRGFFLWADKAPNPQGRMYPFNWSYDFLIQSGE
jgi:uncharacterized repeat protein (TIGR02543 family)